MTVANKRSEDTKQQALKRLAYIEGHLKGSTEQVKVVLDEEGYPVAGTGEGGQKRGFIPLSSK